MSGFVGYTAEQARADNDARKAERRNAEAACALDFLVYGDDEEHGPHAERCLFAQARDAEGVYVPKETRPPACSRNYETMPYPTSYTLKEDAPAVITAHDKALPAGDTLYAGTGIGALYGLPGSEGFLADLAGWNVPRHRDPQEREVERRLAALRETYEAALAADDHAAAEGAWLGMEA